jgi:CubicO group peptidase (beta-lactamase class C family)
MTTHWRLSAWVLLLLAATGASADAAAADRPDDQPAAIRRLLMRWDRDPHADLKAVLVIRDGKLLAERYYNGDTPKTLHDIRSAGKSVTSLLAGAAIDRGKIASVSDRTDLYLKQARGTPVAAIKLADLLTMRSGLDADDRNPQSPGNEDRLDASRDPFAYALSVPRREISGKRYVYNSLTSYLLGAAVAEAVNRPLDAFAADALFRPLGIRHWRWDRDASGRTKGQGNLRLSARDFAQIGVMMLGGGNYRGRRVLSEHWIRESLKPRVAIGTVDPYADYYGYYWYTKTHRIHGRDVRAHFASGNGGNKLYLVPSLDMVVVITSSAYGRGHGQRRSQDILRALLDEFVSA